MCAARCLHRHFFIWQEEKYRSRMAMSISGQSFLSSRRDSLASSRWLCLGRYLHYEGAPSRTYPCRARRALSSTADTRRVMLPNESSILSHHSFIRSTAVQWTCVFVCTLVENTYATTCIPAQPPNFEHANVDFLANKVLIQHLINAFLTRLKTCAGAVGKTALVIQIPHLNEWKQEISLANCRHQTPGFNHRLFPLNF